jgi:hypothetical protein
MFQNYRLSLRILKNIFLCKILSITGYLKYPVILLPRISYKRIINIDLLIERQQVYIVRRSEKPYSESFYEVGGEYLLREDALNHQHIRGLSLNLLGGLFQSVHIKFRTLLKSFASESWNGYTPIFLSEHTKSIEVLENSYSLYFDANNIHNQKIPYNREKTKEFEKEVKKFYENVIAPDLVQESL